LVTSHEDDPTVGHFKISIQEWFTAFLPSNAFLAQKAWMTNTMKKAYIKKVKDSGNRLKTSNHFLTLMTHDEEKVRVFTNTFLKALSINKT
jgi:hypothetical protein